VPRPATGAARTGPNQRLVESELAARYDTSRRAVREALVQLENERPTLRPRNRSPSVRPVTPAEAVEITEVRAVIKGLCAVKAASLATEADHADCGRSCARWRTPAGAATCWPTAVASRLSPAPRGRIPTAACSLGSVIAAKAISSGVMSPSWCCAR
jgi:DNA-binding GntR family transcriptional regulator